MTADQHYVAVKVAMTDTWADDLAPDEYIVSTGGDSGEATIMRPVKPAPERFVLEIRTANAAFENGWWWEVARMLRYVASAIERGSTEAPLIDSNGTTVGAWRYERPLACPGCGGSGTVERKEIALALPGTPTFTFQDPCPTCRPEEVVL